MNLPPLRPHWLVLLALLAAPAGRATEVRPTMLLLDGARTGPAVVVVGERGTILRSTDEGRTWVATGGTFSPALTGVAFAGDTAHGWAVGHDALIVATTDGGLTWRKQWQAENLSDSFLDVLALDAQRVIAVGAYGLFVTTTDGGRTWQRRKLSEDDFHFNRITRGPTGTLYLAGERGTLLRSRDQGLSWSRIDSPYDGSFYGILPLEERTLLAYGLRGRIYRSTDDGDTWTAVPNERRVLLAAAVRAANGTLVLAGQSRALFASRDAGGSVADWAVPFTTAVAELLALPDGSLLALGEAGATRLPAP